MARKHHAKHSKNTILASSATKSFSKLSVGAASAVVGASLALSAAPALAQEMSPTDAQHAPQLHWLNQQTLLQHKISREGVL